MGEHAPGRLRLENRHTGEVLELVRRRGKDGVFLELRGTLPTHQVRTGSARVGPC